MLVLGLGILDSIFGRKQDPYGPPPSYPPPSYPAYPSPGAPPTGFVRETRIIYNINICNRKVLPYVYFVFIRLYKTYMSLFPGKPLEKRRFIKIIKEFNTIRKK